MKTDFELTRIKQMTMREEGGMGKKVGLPDFDSESGEGGGMEGSKCCQLSARIFDLVLPKN